MRIKSMETRMIGSFYILRYRINKGIDAKTACSLDNKKYETQKTSRI